MFVAQQYPPMTMLMVPHTGTAAQPQNHPSTLPSSVQPMYVVGYNQQQGTQPYTYNPQVVGGVQQQQASYVFLTTATTTDVVGQQQQIMYVTLPYPTTMTTTASASNAPTTTVNTTGHNTDGGARSLRCYHCQGFGHKAIHCPSNPAWCGETSGQCSAHGKVRSLSALNRVGGTDESPVYECIQSSRCQHYMRAMKTPASHHHLHRVPPSRGPASKPVVSVADVPLSQVDLTTVTALQDQITKILEDSPRSVDDTSFTQPCPKYEE